MPKFKLGDNPHSFTLFLQIFITIRPRPFQCPFSTGGACLHADKFPVFAYSSIGCQPVVFRFFTAEGLPSERKKPNIRPIFTLYLIYTL
jgi:hypothetical protein